MAERNPDARCLTCNGPCAVGFPLCQTCRKNHLKRGIPLPECEDMEAGAACRHGIAHGECPECDAEYINYDHAR